MGHILKYYVSGHTAEGFVNYLDSNLKQLKKIIVLQHTARHVISDVLKELQKQLGMNQQQEILCSPFRAADMEGLIMPDLSVGFIAEHLIQDKAVKATTVDIRDWLPLEESTTEQKAAKKLQEKAYHHFSTGLQIHDELEKVYIDEMDFAAANEIAENVIKQIFQSSLQQSNKANVYERLFGTNTMDGVVNEVEQLIAPMQHRIFIKGRAGTGKSVLMKKVVEQSKLYGYDTEIYRCSFDPNSVDMVIIRSLGYCLFDSTAPHEFFPSRQSDQVIDLYQRTVTAGTDERYAEKIQRITQAYKAEMKKGIEFLQKMKAYEPTIEMRNEKYTAFLSKISKDIMKKI